MQPQQLSAANDTALTVETDDGVLFAIDIGVALYFTGSQRQTKREAILSIFRDYLELVGDQLTWTTNPQTGRWKKLQGWDSYITPFDWLPSYGRGQWEFTYHGGKRRTDASFYGFSVLGSHYDEIHPRLSSMQCYFPIDFFIDREEKLPALLQRWCEALAPEHGYAGLSLSKSYGYDRSDQSQLLEYRYAQRFPGLQINGFSTHRLNLSRGPKGVDWLTVLSDSWLEKLGGREAVRQQMGALPMLDYADGAILRAGPMPQLGDNDNPETLAALQDYRRVAAIIEPVRIKDHQGIHGMYSPSMANEPSLDDEAYQRWLARFSPGHEPQSNRE
ncbi:type VI immunity family protein [Modicisalibacter sp. MOD 31.J]|uniref:type VI immunity family protein n=2 Tax=unclassified Modicisalibacter TaxID=2679913 RepID=UPI001CC9A1FC|nr:type VI immunity family protein [Modicisalibacter sp. MOD 31.J]MBZ9576361.1 DUF3396 domain-containing protein [Modicisalibacter sp. MOD 31.J]